MPANKANITQAEALLRHTPHTGAVIGNKGYDTDVLVNHTLTWGTKAVISPRSNHKTPRAFDRHKYPARHLIENFFARLKQFRRIATRYKKLTYNFSAIVIIACISIWLL